ncbi:MAG TPA: RsbRD N-terminal domain-containing protein [Nitrospirota bacterium]|nr:RsbRD N-terminal domain-containing protein [Nitrospirota bacterium]
MDLKRLLQERKTAIVKRWFDAVTEAYPDDTSRFLKKKKDQFTNPVGYTISEGIEHLFDALLQGMLQDKVSAFLDSIIRIRAIQDFTPSEAVAFIFRLKKVIRQELGDDILKQQGMLEALSTFDSAIDDLALYSFDIYMKCREKIYELKANEARNMTFRLLQKAQLLDQNKE